MERNSLAILAAVIVGALCAPPALADTVPDVVGLSVDEATSLIEQAGFKATVNRVPGAANIGKVVSQKPGGLCDRAAGDSVSLTVVSPTPKPGPGATPPRDPMPTKPPSDPDAPPAGTGADPLGTPPGGVPEDPIPSDPVPGDPGTPPSDPGTPPTGVPGDASSLPRGRMPNTQGPALPSVLGQTQQQAQASLRRWRVSVEYTLGVPTLIGKVVNQRPHSGSTLAAGEPVVLVVALGESPSANHRSVPQMEGSNWNNAMKAAQNWGFNCDARSVPSSEAERGLVLRQTPLPGSLAVAGTTVRLLVGRGGTGGAAPVPTDPRPVNPPSAPGPSDPTPPPVQPGPSVSNLGTPGLQSPPAGESYPYRYGATFTWTSVSGAGTYEWELQEELPSGAWQKVDTRNVKGERYRPEKLERGRYRWRVRALSGGSKGAWSTFRRLYMY